MSVLNRINSNIKSNLIPGIIVVVPLVITLLVLKWLINFFDDLVQPIIENYIHIYIPGLGLLVSLVFIYLIGLSTKNFFGNKILQVGELWFNKIPIVKTVYSSVKQIMTTIATRNEKQSQKVVLIEYPGPGIFSLGLYNGDILDPDQPEPFAKVLIITSINPASGFTVLVPVSKVRFVDIPIEQMMKFVVSGGIVSPDFIKSQHSQ